MLSPPVPEHDNIVNYTQSFVKTRSTCKRKIRMCKIMVEFSILSAILDGGDHWRLGDKEMSEEQYREIIRSMDDGFCILDVIFDAAGKPVDWRYLETNPQYYSLP